MIVVVGVGHEKHEERSIADRSLRSRMSADFDVDDDEADDSDVDRRQSVGMLFWNRPGPSLVEVAGPLQVEEEEDTQTSLYPVDRIVRMGEVHEQTG